MKKLLCVAVSYVLSISAFCMDLPRGITSEDDILSFTSQYIEGEPGNSYDTTALVKKIRERVDGDSIATKAMEIFLDCKYWHLVDYCEDHLSEMNDNKAQLFREAMILLAFQMSLGNYTQRIVKLIGDPTSITEDYFQNKPFLYDMFIYGAVETAKRGYSWDMPEMCISICSELNILDYIFHREEYDKREKIDIRDIAYDGELREDVLIPIATCVWPNLPDAFTELEWLSSQTNGS